MKKHYEAAGLRIYATKKTRMSVVQMQREMLSFVGISTPTYQISSDFQFKT